MGIFANAENSLKNAHRQHKLTEVKSLILLNKDTNEMRNIISIRFYESKRNFFCCVFLHGHKNPEMDYLQGSSKLPKLTDANSVDAKFFVLQQTLKTMGIELDSLPPTHDGLYFNENKYLCDSEALALSTSEIGGNRLITITMEMLAIGLVPEWTKNSAYSFFINTENA